MLQSSSPVPTYPPSWLDRLVDWVNKLPGPFLLYYLGLWLILFGLRTVIGKQDGSYGPEGVLDSQILIFHAAYCLGLPYTLLLMHFLERAIPRALELFRPAFDETRDSYDRLAQRLSNSPARGTLVAGLAGLLVYGLLFLLLGQEPPALRLATSPLAMVFDRLYIAAGWFAIGTFFYRAIHIARTISQIYAGCTQVDLLKPYPLYAFSSPMARTALSILAYTNLFALVAPGLSHQPLLFAVLITAGLASGLLFVYPFLGVHRLLLLEKRQMQLEAADRLKAAMEELYGRVDRRDLKDADALNKTLASLEIVRGNIERASTWPWHPDVPRILITAILLPILVWVVQRLLNRLGV